MCSFYDIVTNRCCGVCKWSTMVTKEVVVAGKRTRGNNCGGKKPSRKRDKSKEEGVVDVGVASSSCRRHRWWLGVATRLALWMHNLLERRYIENPSAITLAWGYVTGANYKCDGSGLETGDCCYDNGKPTTKLCERREHTRDCCLCEWRRGRKNGRRGQTRILEDKIKGGLKRD